MKTVGTAVIGLGTIGAVHAYWYSQIPESEFIAVCDSRREVVNQFENRYKVKGARFKARGDRKTGTR